MISFKFLSNGFKLSEEDRHNIIWKTHTGKCIPLIWMTNVHISNCLNCLHGLGEMRIPYFYEGKTKFEWIEIFEEEKRIRNNENNLIN